MHAYVQAYVCLPYAWIPMPMFIFPYDLPPCPHNNISKNKIYFLLIKSSNFVLLHMPCYHLRFMHATSPYFSPTMPTFCTCSHPLFHICFLFLTSRVYYGERFWACGPFAFEKLVGHVSIFHRIPPPRYMLYIDFQPPCGAYKGAV